ncbi:MAG: TylF/MycF/NovP-related O-methyltransferase [Pseudomonadota bacterium]|jgi:O-methyltransferase
MKYSYAPIRPVAGYSPWQDDADFKAIYEAVRQHTLVDIFRLHELYALTRQLGKLPEGDILEVGVWRGGSGALLAHTAKQCGLSSQVFLADTFLGVVKAGEKDSKYTGGEHADTSIETVQTLFRGLGLERYEILQGIFPEQTGDSIADRKFRLCHIDVDVYNSAKDVNEWVWPRLVPGGLVVYDDYGFEPCVGVTRYVNEQFDLADRLVLHNLNGHALVVKLY